MEPQIIDYYNETPHGINVIDKLNEEYDQLQSKYEYIKSIMNRYIAPIHIAKTFDEYKKYEKILNEEFPKKIREILNNQEYGFLSILKIWKLGGSLYMRFKMGLTVWIYDHPEGECFKDKIVNELNNITKNKNRKWCEDRIDLALEICLSKYESINDENNEEIIDDLIHHILNDENPSLPDFYTETIEFHTNEKIDNGLELPFVSLYSLNCYHCEKCGILESYIEEDITMRCQDCLYI